MEGLLRSHSRVVIADPVYDKIQKKRYHQHRSSLYQIRHDAHPRPRHHSFHHPHHSSEKLNRYRKAQQKVHQLTNPLNLDVRNCERRVQKIKGAVQLPKVNNRKLYVNRAQKKMEQERIEKENMLLQGKISHIHKEKSRKLQKMADDIQEYEDRRRLSRRSRDMSKQLLTLQGQLKAQPTKSRFGTHE